MESTEKTLKEELLEEIMSLTSEELEMVWRELVSMGFIREGAR